MKEHETKEFLKEKATISSESYKELFGKNFREDWCSTLITKQKYFGKQARRSNMVRVVLTPCLKIPQLVAVNLVEVHPMIRNLFK